MAKQKRVEIKITFVGNKQFKQGLVDKIFELLNSEDLMLEVAKPGCGFTVTSSMDPTFEE